MINVVEQLKGFDKRHGEPQALELIRSQGLTAFQALGFPNKSNEDWKYTQAKSFVEKSYQCTNFAKDFVTANDSFEQQLNKISNFEAYRIVMVDGAIQTHLSSLADAPFKLRTLTEALTVGDIDGSLLTDLKDPFEALNLAFFDQGFCISIAKNVRVDKPVHIVSYTSNSVQGEFEGTMSLPRFVLKMAQGSKATLVESYIGNKKSSGSYFVSPSTDIEVKENAQLEYIRMQQEAPVAGHIGRTNIRVGNHAKFKSLVVELGAKMSRHQLVLTVDGEGAECEINGIYSIGAKHDQHCDLQTYVDFAKGNSQVEQIYKGILDGNSRAIFNGRVLIRQNAAKALMAQINKNLLLSSKAEIDSKPQLEIYNDDVKATHGATIGQLDENEIFYLMSRGISREKSFELISSGFLFELVDKISMDSIKSMIREGILCST